MTLDALIMRIACNQATRAGAVDRLSNKRINPWRGNPVLLQCALFKTAPLTSGNFIDDISNLLSATLNIRDAGPAGTLLVTKTVVAAAMDGDLTFAQWDGNTGQHFTFELSGVDLNWSERDIFFAISVATDESESITIATGRGRISDDGVGEAEAPAAPDYTAWSKAEADARFEPASGGGIPFSAYTGGGPNALDGMLSAALVLGQIRYTVVDDILKAWQIQTGTAAESVEDGIIRPDDHGPGNQRIWKQVA